MSSLDNTHQSSTPFGGRAASAAAAAVVGNGGHSGPASSLGNAEPDKKKQRLETGSPASVQMTLPPIGNRERTNSLSNGRGRPSLPRIHTREEEEEGEVDERDRMQQDQTPPKANGEIAASPAPLSRTNTNTADSRE